MPRKTFAGSKLVRVAAELTAKDEASPPEARPTLMDAVRELTTFIEVRANLGWTDPMIAALLTEAGYPISAGTLRSYRKRLRDERATIQFDVAAVGNAASRKAAAQTPTKPKPAEFGVRTKTKADNAASEPRAHTPSAALDPVHLDQPLARTFNVKATSLPLDRA